MSTGFFNSVVFQRLFKNQKKPLIESKPPVAKLSADIVAIICDWVNDDCLLTLDEISLRLNQQYGISIGQDKIACCFNSLHFSIERLPVPCSFQTNENALTLLRTVFAHDYMKFSNRVNLYFVGTTKVNVNTRAYQGKKASPQWTIKSKTFTISAALRPDKLFLYEIQDSSFTHKESPSNSPEKPEIPTKFINFFRKFCKQLESDGIKRANIIIDVPCYQHVLQQDPDLIKSIKPNYRIDILPGNSSDFSPLESLFDSLRYHIEKFEPTDPENVFDSIKKLPTSVSEIDCSYYFDDALNLIKVWSDMRF